MTAQGGPNPTITLGLNAQQLAHLASFSVAYQQLNTAAQAAGMSLGAFLGSLRQSLRNAGGGGAGGGGAAGAAGGGGAGGGGAGGAAGGGGGGRGGGANLPAWMRIPTPHRAYWQGKQEMRDLFRWRGWKRSRKRWQAFAKANPEQAKTLSGLAGRAGQVAGALGVAYQVADILNQVIPAVTQLLKPAAAKIANSLRAVAAGIGTFPGIGAYLSTALSGVAQNIEGALDGLAAGAQNAISAGLATVDMMGSATSRAVPAADAAGALSRASGGRVDGSVVADAVGTAVYQGMQLGYGHAQERRENQALMAVARAEALKALAEGALEAGMGLTSTKRRTVRQALRSTGGG